jgi:hypothetical protein
MTPTHSYQPKKQVDVEVTRQYYDLQREETMNIGTRYITTYARAFDLESVGFVRII